MEKGPVELVETRNKLISFLEISTDYQPERILPDFPKDRKFLRQGLYFLLEEDYKLEAGMLHAK